MQQEILSLIEKHKTGLTSQEIKAKLNINNDSDFKNTLQTLISSKKIESFQSKNIQKYRLIQKSQEDIEKTVLNLIDQSDTSGISAKDLKLKSNLTIALLNKCLKNLEHQLKIKCVKSLKTNQKIYILYNKNPAEEISGGKFFTEGDVDEVFVEELIRVILFYLHNKTKTSYLLNIKMLPRKEDIKKFIFESKITSVLLNDEDMKSVLDVMVADGIIQEIKREDDVYYRPLKPT